MLSAMLDHHPHLTTGRENLLLIADKGFAVRIAQRILAMTTAIWHNHHTGAPDH